MILEIFMSVVVLIALILSTMGVMKIYKLNKEYTKAIILIPLRKNAKALNVFCAIVFTILSISIGLLVYIESYFLLIMVSVTLLSLLCLFIAMNCLRCAVLDSGIVVPFKFISFIEMCDYRIIGNNKIFFFGDKNGFDTMFAISPKLAFDESNKDKLMYLLNKNRKEI